MHSVSMDGLGVLSRKLPPYLCALESFGRGIGMGKGSPICTRVFVSGSDKKIEDLLGMEM